MPAELVEAIVGGLRKVIYTRLRRGTEGELLGLTEQLAEWSFGYEPPPRPLRRRGGGTGPGAQGELFRSDDPAQRMIAAATETIAERGYPATTVRGISGRASASFSTFYEHFDGKEDVFVAALEPARRSCSRGRCRPTGRRRGGRRRCGHPSRRWSTSSPPTRPSPSSA